MSTTPQFNHFPTPSGHLGIRLELPDTCSASPCRTYRPAGDNRTDFLRHKEDSESFQRRREEGA